MDNKTAQNHIISSVTVIVENKAQYCKDVSDQFWENGKIEQSCEWAKMSEELNQAVEIIRKHLGTF